MQILVFITKPERHAQPRTKCLRTRRDDAFTGMTLCTVPKAATRLGTAPIRADVRRDANALATNEHLPTTRTTELNNMTIPTLRNDVTNNRTNNNRGAQSLRSLRADTPRTTGFS